jgi:hypothetical protein
MSFEKVTSPGKVVVSAALNTGEAATEITAGASKAPTFSRQQKVPAFIAYAPWRHHPNSWKRCFYIGYSKHVDRSRVRQAEPCRHVTLDKL